MSVVLNGRTYSDEDFKGYGYITRFPEGIFADLLAEIETLLSAAHGLPAGGTAGQLLQKLSSTAGDAGWVDLDISAVLTAITDLQAAVAGKAAVSHSHTIGNVTGLQTALDGKAPTTHGHAIADVTGLQGALDGKRNADRASYWAEGGVLVGLTPPSSYITYAQWLAGVDGYWAFIDIFSAPSGAVTATVAPARASGAAAPLTASALVSAVIAPVNAAGTVAALVATATSANGVSAAMASASAVGMAQALTAAYVVSATMATAAAQGSVSALVATASSLSPPATPGPSLVAGDGQITVDWSDVTGETSYNVYYSTSNLLSISTYDGTHIYSGLTATAGKITGIAADSVQRIITGLTNGTPYFVRVSAVNAAGESALSTAISATPAGAIPAAPTISSVVAGDAQLTANWGDVTGETSYTVYYKSGSAPDGTESTTCTASAGKITGIAAGSTSYVISAGTSGAALTNGTTYYVKVSASNASGESALSSAVSGVPAVTPLLSDNFANVSGWGAVVNVAGNTTGTTLTSVAGKGRVSYSVSSAGKFRIPNNTSVSMSSLLSGSKTIQIDCPTVPFVTTIALGIRLTGSNGNWWSIATVDQGDGTREYDYAANSGLDYLSELSTSSGDAGRFRIAFVNSTHVDMYIGGYKIASNYAVPDLGTSFTFDFWGSAYSATSGTVDFDNLVIQ